nr:MAG TPA: hypothetical protein [Caudoviricetes sp.]
MGNSETSKGFGQSAQQSTLLTCEFNDYRKHSDNRNIVIKK